MLEFSSSIYPVVLHSLPLILFCQRGCLSFCSRRAGFSVMSPPDAPACRTAICSSSLFPSSIGTSPAPRSTRALFLSFTRSVSATLSFNDNPWQWRSSSFFVSCDFLCKFQLKSHHLQRRATQAVPVRRLSSIAQCLSRPTFASHNSILGNTRNCSGSIMMTNKDSLSLAVRK